MDYEWPWLYPDGFAEFSPGDMVEHYYYAHLIPSVPKVT